MKLESLFSPEPSVWGLRGDPYLWKELVDTLGKLSMPENEIKLLELLEVNYQKLIGIPLSQERDFIHIERYSHGGMSSGCVSPSFWRKKGFPLLIQRFKEQQTA